MSREAPTHRCYVVEDRAEGKDAIWTPIGSAWPHKDGNGFDVKLAALPATGGRIVIRKVTAKGRGGTDARRARLPIDGCWRRAAAARRGFRDARAFRKGYNPMGRNRLLRRPEGRHRQIHARSRLRGRGRQGRHGRPHRRSRRGRSARAGTGASAAPPSGSRPRFPSRWCRASRSSPARRMCRCSSSTHPAGRMPPPPGSPRVAAHGAADRRHHRRPQPHHPPDARA